VAKLEACPMHERVSIDKRNGLRAGEGCPARFVEERTFERFEGVYTPWAHAARREQAPAEYSPLCPRRGAPPEATGAGSLRIDYPRDGARFLIDPARPRAEQAVGIRVDAPPGTSRVSVRVDGRVLAELSSPFVARWPLASGEHVVVAEATGRGPSAPIVVRVE
jgi:penicillin-binding protein 1C